jgi:prephenate dehydrogenase
MDVVDTYEHWVNQQSSIDNQQFNRRSTIIKSSIMELPVIQPGRLQAGEAPIFQKIGIVGLGLIGGSIALAARQLWPASLVIAVDNKDVLETAMRLHAIDVAADDLIVLAEADLVILAAPVRQNLRLIDELDDNVRGAAVVTDTGSTKRAIATAARRLPPRFMFVGGHPLGGAAVSGLEHARPDLFKNRPWLLTPVGDAAGAPTEKLAAFASALGASPRILDVDTHDRLLAFLSHLPQLTASALMQIVGSSVGEDGLSLAGRGLVDTTRLAESAPAIWKDVAATNADHIGDALDALIALLQDLKRDLKSGDRLDEVFTEASQWRQRLK